MSLCGHSYKAFFSSWESVIAKGSCVSVLQRKSSFQLSKTFDGNLKTLVSNVMHYWQKSNKQFK